MRFLQRVLQIVSKKDIDWIEIIIGWFAIGFCLVLLAPGDYFADTPRLHTLERPLHGIYLPEGFWLCFFGILSLAQGLAIAAGETPLRLSLPLLPPRGIRHTLLVSPYLIRMRVLALGTGAWGSLLVLALPAARIWHGVPISMAVWLFLGMALFSLIGALRMTGEVARNRDQERRQRVMEEAEHLAALILEVGHMEPQKQVR